MKLVAELSSIALVLFASIYPCQATNLSNHSAKKAVSSQTYANHGQSIQVAGLLDSLFREVGKVQQTQQRLQRQAETEQRRQEAIERRKSLERERQRQIEANQQQQEERLAAAKAKQEQERKYFESLTPAQRKAYLAKQQAEQDAAARMIINILGAGMNNSNSDNSSGLSEDEIKANERDKNERNWRLDKELSEQRMRNTKY